MQQKRAYWRELDNVGKMYSATSNHENTRVFRFYCVLKEDISLSSLQLALDQTLETYPIFLSVMRKGLFWHYLEKSSLRPVVKEEKTEPCSSLYIKDKKALLFKVTYYHNRINFEVFHALTDGTGATAFLKELVKNYLCITHAKDGLCNTRLLDEHVTVSDQESDSFSKYYNSKEKVKARKEKAFQLPKPKKQDMGLRIHEASVNVSDVLKQARAYHVSMSMYLTAVLMMAIQKEMKLAQKKHPVVVMVPVNLRKFFPSSSMLNFFNCITPSFTFDEKDCEFGCVITQVDRYFKEQLTKEKVAAHMNQLIALEKHPLLRIAPLEVKNLGIKVGTRYAERDATAIFSNMSVIDLPKEYVPYIERFGVFMNTPKLELTMVSFEGVINFSFTSRFDTSNIQRNFYQILEEQGIQANKIMPDYPTLKPSKQWEKKWIRMYTFITLLIVVACFFVEKNFLAYTHWPTYVAAGVATVWVASLVGYKKRHNLLKNAMWQLVLLSIGCVAWDFFIGWSGWSCDFVLPVLCMSILLFMFAISRARKDTPREYMIYYVMACVYGIVVPLILTNTHVVHYPMLSHICMAVSFVVLAGLVIFKGKEFQEEMGKKLHL